MRFINAWSYSCANQLTSQLKESHEKRRVYYYGFQILIGAIIKGILLLLITFLLGTIVPTLSIVLVFATLRVIAGGYHMDTYGKCIAVSLALFVVSGALAKYTYEYWGITYIIAIAVVSFFIGLWVLVKWAPSDNPNRPITKPEEIKKFRRLSFVYIFIWLVLISLLTIYNFKMFVLAGCFGLLLEVFAISPAGHKFFDIISGKISKNKN